MLHAKMIERESRFPRGISFTFHCIHSHTYIHMHAHTHVLTYAYAWRAHMHRHTGHRHLYTRCPLSHTHRFFWIWHRRADSSAHSCMMQAHIRPHVDASTHTCMMRLHTHVCSGADMQAYVHMYVCKYTLHACWVHMHVWCENTYTYDLAHMSRCMYIV